MCKYDSNSHSESIRLFVLKTTVRVTCIFHCRLVDLLNFYCDYCEQQHEILRYTVWSARHTFQFFMVCWWRNRQSRILYIYCTKTCIGTHTRSVRQIYVCTVAQTPQIASSMTNSIKRRNEKQKKPEIINSISYTHAAGRAYMYHNVYAFTNTRFWIHFDCCYYY